MRVVLVILWLALSACAVNSPPGLKAAEFEGLMQTVAAGWNEDNARKAAGCFTEDAIYSEPPDKQLYQSRAALFKFFGGDKGRKTPMKMTWHHLAFNEQEQ